VLKLTTSGGAAYVDVILSLDWWVELLLLVLREMVEGPVAHDTVVRAKPEEWLPVIIAEVAVLKLRTSVLQ